MAHNIMLPRHRYVWVAKYMVMNIDIDGPHSLEEKIPAVWWGVSVTPNRLLGCHVLLENGAMVIDVPLMALSWLPETVAHQEWVHHATWDSYGWDAEIVASDYLDAMPVKLLDHNHKLTDVRGELWFAVDHVRDGFSMEPAQHKHLWVVAVEDGRFAWLPQDQLLLLDKSFTTVANVPPVKRQDTVYRVEDGYDLDE